MNTPTRISTMLLLAAFSVAPLGAEFETVKIEPTIVPELSPVMVAQGITDGRLTVALDVSPEGKVTDCLVLGYTHPALVAPFREALKSWRFSPARQDGQPVPVQVNLTVNYSAEGAVISQPAVLNLEQYLQRIFGQRLSYKARLASELDGIPPRLESAAPKYAKQAVQDGVTGIVRVHFYIDETGAVRMPAIEGEAHPYLAERALEAVREWRFAPPTAKGKPVLVAARQEFNFQPLNR